MRRNDAPLFNPVSAAWNTVARFDDYEAAQRAVDQLSDNGFPVEKLDIVGSDLRLIERVTGRLTKARAAGAGAVSGLWAGLLIGVLLGLFTTGHAWLGVVAVAAAFGVLGGAVFGFVAHAATRGQRDFSSVRVLSAGHYDLIARGGSADQARAMLAELGLAPTATAAGRQPPADPAASPGARRLPGRGRHRGSATTIPQATSTTK